MTSTVWARLRPCDANLSVLVKFLFIGECVLLMVAAAWSIVHFFGKDVSRTALELAFNVYVIVLATMLLLAEIGFPSGLYALFGFLESSAGRAGFLFFLSPLVLIAGFSGDRSAIPKILLVVAGFTGIVLAVLGLCYGKDVQDASDARELGDPYPSRPGRGAARSSAAATSSAGGRPRSGPDSIPI